VAHDTSDNWNRFFFIAAVTVIELRLFFYRFQPQAYRVFLM